MGSFLRDRAGSIAPLFAVAAIPLLIAVGGATDVGRTIDVRSQLQDISDSAALAAMVAGVNVNLAAITATGSQASSATILSSEQSAAANFVSAEVAKLPGNLTVTPTYPTRADTTTFQVHLASNVPTTFAALVTPSIAVSSDSVAQGTVGVNVRFTINNYNSSASDLDQIYYYSYPTGSATSYTPTLATSNIVLSDAAGFSNINQTVQIPVGTVAGFAMANTTGGVSGYGSNCYGQAQGVKHIYYSHREDASGSYWDYSVPAFTACTSSSSSSLYNSASITYNGSTLLTPCSSSGSTSDYKYVSVSGFTSKSSSSNSTCKSSVTYPAGDYVYYTDVNTAWRSYDTLYGTPYSLNPLRFGTTNTDCTKGDVQYEWDDNGGGVDDSDYNDMVFTVNCTTSGVQKSSIKLIS